MMDKVKHFERYENGKKFNYRLDPNPYTMSSVNWNFFSGKQWENAGLNPDMPQPVFNVIARFVTFFVSSITATGTKVQFDMALNKEGQDIDMIVNQSWREFFERVKGDWQGRNALYDGAITGSYVAHVIMDMSKKPFNGVYSDVEGLIDLEIVDGTNFYMSNPNSRDVQSQSWVAIVGRDTIENLNKEIKDISEIYSDGDTDQQIGDYGKIEMEGDDGKATYVISYERKKGKIYVSKCVQGQYIFEDIETDLKLYPIALGNWELQKNLYLGRSFVTGIIPNQIFINRGFAMAMLNTQLTSMPKLLYNKDKISSWSSQIGTSIGVNLLPGESLSNVAEYTNPGNMSSQVMQMIDMAFSYTKEAVGASDALMGNVNPEKASGTAIAVTSKQAGVPLENPKANYYNWWEDIGRIYLDMITATYGKRPVYIENNDEENQMVDFDFSTLSENYLKVKVDVGATTYWSEFAAVQTLDNLLANGMIEFIQYLERMPDGYITDKQGLIDNIKEKMAQETQGDPVQEMLSQMSPEAQQQFGSLPPEQQKQLLDQFMNQGGANAR